MKTQMTDEGQKGEVEKEKICLVRQRTAVEYRRANKPKKYTKEMRKRTTKKGVLDEISAFCR